MLEPFVLRKKVENHLTFVVCQWYNVMLLQSQLLQLEVDKEEQDK